MTRIYIALLALSAFALAASGAYFSIAGLAQLFSGATISVIIMASALEFAKFTSTGFLYRYWGHILKPLRVYLIGAIIALMGITSLGIFGYLSGAYQKSSLVIKEKTLKLKTMEEENQRVVAQVAEVRRFIDEIPNSRISKKFEFQQTYEPKIRALLDRSEEINNDIAKLKFDILTTNTKIGPIIYAAEALHVEPDTIARVLILVLVLVFDPLAVCLIFCLNLAIRLKEKYRGDESRIAAHSMMAPPVDHRFKKEHKLKKVS